jgi:hypothetical protein
MEWYWIALIIVLFVLWTTYVWMHGFKRGYKYGGMKVLNAWKETIGNAEEEIKNAGFNKTPFL